LKLDFDALHAAFRRKVDSQLPRLATSEDAQERRLVINQASRDLEEAEEIIAEMDARVRATTQTSQKLKASALARTCRESLRVCRKDLQKWSAGFSANDRAQLLGGGGGATAIDVNDGDPQRERLLRGSEQLQSGTERLRNIQRIAAESETIGTTVLGDLGQQREQIVRSRNAVTRIRKQLDHPVDRNTKATLIQYGTIGVLILLIIIAIYVKYIR
ncbi:hypothetical protein HDU82_000075, partial [Entophlyctis luteolus]